MNDFAPHIYRRRLIVEGIYRRELTADTIDRIIQGLTSALGMQIVFGPQVMRFAEEQDTGHKGFEAVTVWVKSGCTLLTWEDSHFFTCDIYSCKPFADTVVWDYLSTVLDCEHIDMRAA